MTRSSKAASRPKTGPKGAGKGGEPSDPSKKYWWIILVLVPVATAIVPKLIDSKAQPAASSPSTAPPSAPAAPATAPAAAGPPGAAPSAEHLPQPEPPRTPADPKDNRETTTVASSPGRQAGSKVPAAPPAEGKPSFVQAKGVGFAPPNVADPRRRVFMAQRAAETDAMRALAEALHGALVESTSQTKFGELAEDVINVRVQALLKGAVKVGEKENPDGSFEVTMKAPLRQ